MDGHDQVPNGGRVDTRLTYEDFLLFPDDGKRHELIDGVHYVTPSPNTRHQELLGRLHVALALHVRANPAVGRVFLSPFDVVFSTWDVVEPDLLFIARDQLDILTEKNVQGSPALVIEILSPRTRKRDEQIKRRLFDRAGVREYWLVDPEREVVGVFRRVDDGQLRPAAELAASRAEVLQTPLLPQFALAMAELFAA